MQYANLHQQLLGELITNLSPNRHICKHIEIYFNLLEMSKIRMEPNVYTIGLSPRV